MMNGPLKSVTNADMKNIDYSKEENEEVTRFKAKRALEENKKMYLEGADDDLSHLGFIPDDEKVDFSKFKTKKNKNDVEEVVEEYSLFGKLTSAFKNITGNKVLTK